MTWLSRRLLAGFRGRRGTAALIAALAAIVAVVAATSPILTRVVQQSAVDHTLRTQSALERSVLGNATSNDEVDVIQAGIRASRVSAALRTPGVWAAGRTYREQNDTPLTWSTPSVRSGQPKERIADVASCADLRFVDGACPQAIGDAAVAQSTFDRAGLRLGQQVVLKSLIHTVTVRIVGVYDATSAAGRLQAHPSSTVSAPVDGLDPDLLLSPIGYTAVNLPTTAFSVRTLRTHVPLADLPSVRRDLARAEAVPLAVSAAQASTHTVTDLGSVLDRIDAQVSVAAVILQVVAAGAFALAVIALGVVAQRLGRVRAAEWALPRLRGMPRRRLLGARLGESLLPLAVGAVVGAAGTALVAIGASDGVSRGSVLATIPAAIGLSAAATAAGAIAFVAVSVAADRRPLDEQLRRSTEPGQLSRPALVGSAAIVVGALAAVVALLAAPGTAIDGAGLLAPILIALAVALVGLQLALLVARRRTRTVPSSLVTLIVWRRLSRAPSQATASVLLAGAVALGTFVTLTATTADALADATAQASAGAPTVLSVRAPADLPLLTAVRRADPGGTRALAAEESRLGDGTATVVAVDTARLAAVSSWRSEWAGLDAATLVRRLAPPVQPSLQLRGTRIRMAVDDVAPGSTDYGAQRFGLTLTLQTGRGFATVALGPFAPSGSHVLTASIPCAQGCTFVSLSGRCAEQYPPPWSLQLRIASVATDVEPASRFASVLEHGSWMTENGNVLDASLPISSSARAGAGGLQVALADTEGGARPAIRIRDTVEPLPVLVGSATVPERFPGADGAITGTGLDGSALLLRSVGTASALPRALGDGVLVDLQRMLPQTDRTSAVPEQQVWVRGDVRPIERALRAQSVRILRVGTLGAAAASERSEAGPLSARFALVGAAGALAVVLLALLGSRLITGPARRRQWASFASGGVAPRELRRLAALEFGSPAAAGVVVGALSGAVAFLLALPHLPLADGAPEAPPSGILPPWALGAVFPALALVAVLLITGLVAVTETRAGGDR